MIEGRGPAPLFVLSLIQRLPDTSLTRALMAGGREHFGWGQDRYIAADLYDAISLNTRVTWGSRAPAIPHYPRPGDPVEEKPKTVADVFKRFKQLNPQMQLTQNEGGET